jgi:hypothetical protein
MPMRNPESPSSWGTGVAPSKWKTGASAPATARLAGLLMTARSHGLLERSNGASRQNWAPVQILTAPRRAYVPASAGARVRDSDPRSRHRRPVDGFADHYRMGTGPPTASPSHRSPGPRTPEFLVSSL